MQMRSTILVLMGAAVLTVGCASKPTRQPRILSSYTPPGVGQPAPLNSRQAIQVPQADVGVRPAVPVTPVIPAEQIPVHAVPVPAPQGQLVPAQPAVPAQPVVPAQPSVQTLVPNNVQQVPAYPGAPNGGAPANSQQYQQNGGAGQQEAQGYDYNYQQQNGGYDSSGRLPVPPPANLDQN